jgi:serine/threonine protein kinase
MSSHRFGNYELQSLLGRGGMAEVFRARSIAGKYAGRPVAVKRLLPELANDPAFVDLFTSEADLTRFLEHPNIVRVHEVGVIGETYFIGMELIDGRDLSQVLGRCRERRIPLPVDFAVFLAWVLAEALSYAHGAKDHRGQPLQIIHRDISPSNVFISRTGEIKLGDFGVAQVRIGTGDGRLPGKQHYLSAETLAGLESVQTDLWAANVVLYEMLTLTRPFDGPTPEACFEAIRRRRYRKVREVRPEVSQPLSDLVDQGFARQAKDRFVSAADLRDALARHFDPNVGTPLAIASVVRGLFGASEG